MLRDAPLGPPIYWILPRQATFQAERELTCASGLGGFCRARVVSFSQFASDVLAECGGSAVPPITRLGRQMIMGHLLRMHDERLRFFASSATQPGLAARLEVAIAEFERCGKGPEELASVLNHLTHADDESLSAKLHDIHLIYKAYCDFVGQERLDVRRRMRTVLHSIQTSRRLRGCTVFIDGFTHFDEFERQIIAKLAEAARELEVMLLLDESSPVLADVNTLPAELSVFHRSERAFAKLMQALRDEHVALEPPVVLDQVHRFAAEELRILEREGMRPTCAYPGDVGAIELVEAPGRREEVEHAARTIGRLLREGMRLRDIVVLVRQVDAYHDLVREVFDEHDLPCFIDRRRPVSHHPLAQFVLSLLAIVQDDWPHGAVMMLLKSGLSGLTAAEADELENYVLEHHLRGRVWARAEPWQYARQLTRAEEADDEQTELAGRMDALRRRICEAVRPLADATGTGALSVRELTLELLKAMDRFGAPQTLGRWIAAAREAHRHEEAGQHEQVWSEFVDLLDQLVDLLGDEKVRLADYAQILSSGLESFDLAITPPTVDQILVGQIDRTRSPQARAVLVLGLNDGEFPLSRRGPSVLIESERQFLRNHAFDVDPGETRSVLDETLLGYIAFTRASEKLYVSRSLADSASRPLEASPFWRNLRQLFPDLQVQRISPHPGGEISLIATPRELISTLLRWVRAPDHLSGEQQNTIEALYQRICSEAPPAVASLRDACWRALRYENRPVLDSATAARLFGSPLRATAGQIESFAACPFQHFARYGLNLRARDESDLAEIQLERTYRRILENLVREMLRRGQNWSSLSSDQASKLVRQFTEQIGQTLQGELMLSSARNRYLLTRIKRGLEQFITSQRVVADRQKARIRYGQLAYGDYAGGLPALTIDTPSGHELHLSGRIDRVDVLEGEAACAILDYRMYGSSLDLTRVRHGLSVQLLAACLAMQTHGRRLTGRDIAPAAAFYVRLLNQIERKDHPSQGADPADPESLICGKQRGIYDERYVQLLDCKKFVDSPVIAARRTKEETLGYKNATDFAVPEEFAALLDRVRQTLGELADQICGGNIDCSPYRIGTRSPCSRCDHHSVCRFDPVANRYRIITRKKRDQILAECLSGNEETDNA